MKIIGVAGSLATILGLGMSFWYPKVPAQANGNSATTYSEQSPAVGHNDGDITINYGNRARRDYVLKNPKIGAVLIVASPDLTRITDRNFQVCTVPAGTRVKLTGRKARQGQVDMWREVQVTEGECSGKTGWVALENISRE